MSTPGPQQPYGEQPPPPPLPGGGGAAYARPVPAPHEGRHPEGQAYPGRGPSRAEGDDRVWMILAHLSAPIAAVASVGLLSLLGPLVVWLLRKDSSPQVRAVSAGAFNFNLSFWLMNLIAWICFVTVLLIPVAIVIWVVIWPVAAIYHILGAVRAAKGRVLTYPFQIRVLQ